MRRTSALKSKILENLDPKVIANAKSISVVVEGFEDRVMKEPIEFEVGDYIVTVEAKGSRSNPDLFLSCTCRYWQYQGAEYHALRNGYLFGKTIGTADEPTKRDPEGTHKLCKHAYAILRDFFGA